MKNENEIGVFGVAVKIGVICLAYLGATIILSLTYKSTFNINFISREILFIIGLVLIIIGQSVNGVASAKMIKGFFSGQLVTEGPFSVCANPICASQIFLSVPGVALMLGSWLVLSTTIVGFIVVKLFIGKKEEYLREKFGAQYEEYRKRILIKFI